MKISQRTDLRAWVPIVSLQLAYGLYFLVQSSMLVDGVRYFMLFDDSMISMSYARTFAEGGGLVWFHGAEHVQGYTNLLWTLMMAGVHLLPIPFGSISLVIQMIGIALVPLTSFFAAKSYRLLCPETRDDWMIALLLGCYFPFYLWAGLGMEAGFITFLLAVTMFGVIRTLIDGEVKWGVFLVMATGLLTRLDYAIFAVASGLFLLYAARDNREQFRRTMLGGGLLVLLVAGICLAQVLYYGDPLPNTFALKLGVPASVRITRGFSSSVAFAGSLSYPVLLLCVFALIKLGTRTGASLYLMSITSVAIAYNVLTGGDAWEWGAHANRFQLPIVPVVFMLLAFALEFTVTRLRLTPRASRWLLLGLGLVVVVRVNAGFTFDAERAANNLNKVALREPIMTRAFHDLPMLKAGLLLRDVTTAPLNIAVASAGITPYTIGKGRFIDILGRSDRLVAHLPPHDVPYVPGHVKWNLRHSIDKLDADICIGTWCRRPDNYLEPMATLPGPYAIYVKKSVLREKFVALDALLATYRRYAYGSDLQFFASMFEMRGFRMSQSEVEIEMQQAGVLVFPADANLSFRYRARIPIELSIWLDDELLERFGMSSGEARETRVRGNAGQRLRLIAEYLDSAESNDKTTLVVEAFSLHPRIRIKGAGGFYSVFTDG